MSDEKKTTRPKPKAVGIRPRTRPKPAPKATPRATLPPMMRPVFGRPMAGSPSHHRKRFAERHGSEPAGSVTAKRLDKGEGELLLFGSIGEDFFGKGITAESFNDALNDLGDVSTIRLRINSGGGDVFEATAIYNMLIKHNARVIVEIEGVSGSAATIITMAGDEIHISENAQFMIHSAQGIAWGTAEQLRQYLKLLDNADELIRLTYSRRTGIPTNKLVGMMDHDNWMTAQEALDLGFVDVIDEAKTVEPHISPDDPENKSTNRPASITTERLAAMADSLLSLAAETGHRVAASAKNTGGKPSIPTATSKEPDMNAKLRTKCIAAGMSDSLTGTAADKWLDEHFDDVVPADAVTTVTTTSTDTKPFVGLTAEQISDLLDARDRRKLEARITFHKEVDALLLLAIGEKSLPELRNACYDLQADGIEAVHTAILEAKKKADEVTNTGGVGINLSPSQPRDRHLAAIRDGLLVRSMKNFVAPEPKLRKTPDGAWDYAELSADDVLEKHLPEKNRAKDWQDFERMPLLKISEECLLADGVSHEKIRGLTGPQVAMAAMGHHSQAGIRAEAIHTTGSLIEVTRDAVNKSLAAGYEEAPQTWRGPMRQGTSVSDFKDIHRVKLGAAANLPVWPDNTDPEEAKLSNEKEKYAVEARAETLSFSWRLIINDDLDALSRRPQLLGDAAARTVNSVAWNQVTSNPSMTDGQVLFLETPAGNRKRKNLTTGSATPTNTTIGAMKALMRLMRGLNTPEQVESQDILNLTPTYMVGPASLEELILKQIFSGADPASNLSSAVYNTSRTLTPIIEPLLDANSTTAFYLVASPSRVDTVEVTFMTGYETPVAHEWMDDKTMSQNFTIIQVFEAKALDHRGVQRHDGV